jgi:hypothetical protein
MLVAAAQLGRYCLSISDNLPSSRRGSQSGRFQSRADRDALRNGGTGSASDEATQSGDRHGPDGDGEARGPATGRRGSTAPTRAPARASLWRPEALPMKRPIGPAAPSPRPKTHGCVERRAAGPQPLPSPCAVTYYRHPAERQILTTGGGPGGPNPGLAAAPPTTRAPPKRGPHTRDGRPVSLHHAVHAAHAARHACAGGLLLRHLGNDRLGGEDVLGDRRRVLERGAGDHCGIDHAGLD